MSDTHDIGLSILVPVYNERDTIRQVLEKVRGVRFPVKTEIVAVDDGSRDGSGDVLRSLPSWDDVRVFFHEKNAGKGAAIQTAMKHARGRLVVIQDADLELEPSDLLPLFETVQRGEAAVCYGSRFLGDNRHLRRLPTYWANRVLNLICNLINGLHITDMNTCYKMMRADVARRVNLVSRGFAMEPEITTKLARMGVRIREHSITYRPRGKEEGKKIRPFDFVRYLAAMVRFRLAT
jgi:glycosyltransferase involved in cell wall biosynthesis